MQSDELAEQSVESLVRLAQAADDNQSRRSDGVWALQNRGTRDALDAATRLGASQSPRDRALGAEILGQGLVRGKTFHEEAVIVLLRMLATEDDPGVLSVVAVALGHRRDPRAVGPLADLRGHPDSEVRFGVVLGLLTWTDDRAVDALIALSADADDDVRDWATFGLGSQIASDTPALRDALALRLADPDLDTRAEAIVGLARRRDERVVPALVAAMVSGWDTDLIREAVEEVRHPMVLDALSRVRDRLYDEARAWADSVLDCTR